MRGFATRIHSDSLRPDAGPEYFVQVRIKYRNGMR
jgi:hypothetical protein